MIYLIGSLRNPQVPVIANILRAEGFDVFDDWHCVGPDTDDCWRDYEKQRGRSYAEALKGAHAKDVFEFDKKHLEMSDTVVLVMPAGKSAFMELGWMLGQGKKGYVLLDNPERWDIMLQFADGVFDTLGDVVEQLKKDRTKSSPVRKVTATEIKNRTKSKTLNVLFDVQEERWRQDEKFGPQQSRRDGTHEMYARMADEARDDCDADESLGSASWRHVMTEEVLEAFAETDPERLRKELVQVAATAVVWIEDIDRRKK